MKITCELRQISLMIILVIIHFSACFSLDTNNKQIFLLAGQSNMAGRGGVEGGYWDGFVPVECTPDSRISRLSKNLTWEVAEEPLHIDIEFNKISGVGPGMPFSNALLAKDTSSSSIGLVPCSQGGTTISQWQRGEFLYNRLVERAHAALVDGGYIRAMLWYQGESDCNDTVSASMYGGRLTHFFTDLRYDLGYSSMPIVQVALASTAGTYVDVVRKQQLELDLPEVVCVDAYGLEVKKYDPIHLSTSGQVELGGMLADALLSSGF